MGSLALHPQLSHPAHGALRVCLCSTLKSVFFLLVLLQTLTKEGFDSISSSSKQLLAVALQELEVKAGSGALSKQLQLEQNVALFLWSESPGDLPGDAAWVSVGQRGPFARSGLAMKAQALTPCVQSFCSTLDSKLKARLEDVLSYLPGDDPVPKEPAVPPRSAFDRFADASTVQGLLRERCVSCIQHLLGCIQEQLQSAQSQLDTPGETKLNAVLFMARLCQALPELCPHLQRCVLGQAGGAEPVPKEPRSAKKLGKGKAQEVSPELAQWKEVKAELLQQSLLAYQLWSSAITKVRSCFPLRDAFWGGVPSLGLLRAPCAGGRAEGGGSGGMVPMIFTLGAAGVQQGTGRVSWLASVLSEPSCDRGFHCCVPGAGSVLHPHVAARHSWVCPGHSHQLG